MREFFVLSIKGAVHLRNAELPWLVILTLRKPSVACRLSLRSAVCQERRELSHEGRKVKFYGGLFVCLTELVISLAGKETRAAQEISQAYNDQYCKVIKLVLKLGARSTQVF